MNEVNVGGTNAVQLTVRDIHRAVYFADSSRGDGKASAADLGTVFHGFMSNFFSAHESEIVPLFAGASREDWQSELTDYAYDSALRPFLTNNAAALNGRGEHIQDLWLALREAAEWLVGLFWDHRQRVLEDGRRFDPKELADWFRPEVPLRLELTDPSWTRAVVLKGVADSVLSPPSGKRCVIEFKLGQTSPEADVCQTALYQMMLGGGEFDSLAVVSFLPQKMERLLAGKQVAALQAELKALIGKLAGVVNGQAPKVMPTSAVLQASEVVPTARKTTPPKPSVAQEIEQTTKRLRAALNEGGCDATLVGDPVVGPTFIRYALTPARGVPPKRFLGCGELLQVRLQLQRPPVIQTGAAITIDLQRPDREFVNWPAIVLPNSDPLHGCPEVIVGVGLDGKLRTADLSDSASYHLLVAGTSGSGKSEWLRTAVAGLIATNMPQHLQIVAIDPKRVAFHDLQHSPYLRCPVIFPGDAEVDVIEVLDELIEEMERRYAMLGSSASLKELVARTGESIPRIVCVCDEYGDLMLGAAKQRAAVEMRITRLGAKARASGIHLILATQQPSRKTITGAIQTNLPGRVGLTMTSPTESRMLLGEAGAENLLMRGDLLYKDIGAPKRYQAVYLSDQERKQVFSRDFGSVASNSDCF